MVFMSHIFPTTTCLMFYTTSCIATKSVQTLTGSSLSNAADLLNLYVMYISKTSGLMLLPTSASGSFVVSGHHESTNHRSITAQINDTGLYMTTRHTRWPTLLLLWRICVVYPQPSFLNSIKHICGTLKIDLVCRQTYRYPLNSSDGLRHTVASFWNKMEDMMLLVTYIPF